MGWQMSWYVSDKCKICGPLTEKAKDAEQNAAANETTGEHSMGWQASWSAKCDKCKTCGPVRGKTKDAESDAVACDWVGGWSGSNRYHLCPKCRTEDNRPMGVHWDDWCQTSGTTQ